MTSRWCDVYVNIPSSLVDIGLEADEAALQAEWKCGNR